MTIEHCFERRLDLLPNKVAPTSGVRLACVPVSTAETPVIDSDLDESTTYGEPISEASAVRHLIKHCGWIHLEAGVIRRPWKGMSK